MGPLVGRSAKRARSASNPLSPSLRARPSTWLALMIAALALLSGMKALPSHAGSVCPPNSLFMFSAKIEQSICACEPGFDCVGDECFHGSSAEKPTSFKQHEVTGFPMSCGRCACANSNNSSELFVFNNQGQMRKYRHDRDVEDVVYYLHPDEHFDAQCHVNDSVRAPPPRALSRMNWVHFPKAGTSLTTVLYNYLCKDFQQQKVMRSGSAKQLMRSASFQRYADSTCHWCWRFAGCGGKENDFGPFYPHDGFISCENKVFTDAPQQKFCTGKTLGRMSSHRPVPANLRSSGYEGFMIGLFRDPRRRVKSAFNFFRHAMGMPEHVIENLKHTKTLEEFLAFPGISSCQTKQLMGTECGDFRPVLNIYTVVAAAQRLAAFAFYGITDFYTTSVCLFHRMYGGRVHGDELKNVRPTASYEKELMEKGYSLVEKNAWTKLSVTRDPLDWLLYVVALDGFFENVVKYGLEVSEKLRAHTEAVWRHCSDWINHVKGQEVGLVPPSNNQDNEGDGDGAEDEDEDLASLFQDPAALPHYSDLFSRYQTVKVSAFERMTKEQAHLLPYYAQRTYANMFEPAGATLKAVARQCLAYKDPPEYVAEHVSNART